MFAFDLDYILSSDITYQLIGYSVLVVIVVCWIKKRQLKFQERKIFRKRQKVESVLDELDDSPTQLDFDF